MLPPHVDEIDRDDPTNLARFRSLDPAPHAAPSRTLPTDARLLVGTGEGASGSGGRPLARASIRVVEGLTGAPGRTGLIGHYESIDHAVGVTVLTEALARLSDEGVERVVGPMDGTTWDRYRLALPTPAAGDPAPFLTEPVNPPDYPAQFEAAGLGIEAWYVSQIVEDLGALAERTRDPARALSERGIHLDPLDPDRFDRALEELHVVSLEAFADNPYYSPISFDRFRALYAPMKELLDPDLVLVARTDDGAVAGFALSFPDLLDPAGRPTRVVVKTLAVAPGGRGLGLGSLLVHETHRRAAEKGYDAAIHALMHVGNASLKISSHGGRLFRHYALYGWTP